MSSPTQHQWDRPPTPALCHNPRLASPGLRAPLDRRRHHLGRYAAVPGLLSPSPELPAPARDHLTKAVLPAWHLGRPCREGAQTKHSSAFSCVGVPADLGPRVFHSHLWQGWLKMTLLSLFFYPSHRGSLLPGEIGDNFKLREEQPSKRNKLYNHHARATKVSRPSSISNTSLLISEICIVLTLRLGSNRTEILLTVNFADNQNLFKSHPTVTTKRLRCFLFRKYHLKLLYFML